MHSKTLLQILKPLAVAVEVNPTIPALENVCIRQGRAITSNLALTISNKCDLPDMMLPYRELINILNVVDDELSFTITDTQIELKAGKPKYKFGAPGDANSFPKPQLIEAEETKVNADFFYAVQQAAKNESQQENSQWRGIFIGGMYVVGNDNFGMFKQDIETGLPNIHAPALFARSVTGWQEGLMRTNGKHLQCSNNGLEIDLLLIDDTFPKLESAMPAVITPNVSLDRKAFETALKQSQVYEPGIITMKFEPGSIEIVYTNNFAQESFIPIEAKHELSLSIDFNSTIFSRLISCLPPDCEAIQMQITAYNKAVFIVHNNITLLIMPYRK